MVMNKLAKSPVKTTKLYAQSPISSFSREITVALTVKFLLLGILWWFLFAGKKQPVNDGLVANKLLGAEQTVFASSNIRRNPK